MARVNRGRSNSESADKRHPIAEDLAFTIQEAKDALNGEIRHSSWRCHEQGVALGSIASRIVDLSAELVNLHQSERVATTGHELRGIAFYLFSVIGELEREAGRLDAITSLHSIFEGETAP